VSFLANNRGNGVGFRDFNCIPIFLMATVLFLITGIMMVKKEWENLKQDLNGPAFVTAQKVGDINHFHQHPTIPNRHALKGTD